MTAVLFVMVDAIFKCNKFHLDIRDRILLLTLLL